MSALTDILNTESVAAAAGSFVGTVGAALVASLVTHRSAYRLRGVFETGIGEQYFHYGRLGLNRYSRVVYKPGSSLTPSTFHSINLSVYNLATAEAMLTGGYFFLGTWPNKLRFVLGDLFSKEAQTVPLLFKSRNEAKFQRTELSRKPIRQGEVEVIYLNMSDLVNLAVKKVPYERKFKIRFYLGDRSLRAKKVGTLRVKLPMTLIEYVKEKAAVDFQGYLRVRLPSDAYSAASLEAASPSQQRKLRIAIEEGKTWYKSELSTSHQPMPLSIRDLFSERMSEEGVQYYLSDILPNALQQSIGNLRALLSDRE